VLAAHSQGQFLVSAGRLADGLRMLDEALLAVSAGDVSPIPTGIVYCGAIMGCRRAYDPRRAEEWTEALHAWCRLQPEMLAFTGACHVHRAEIMQLHGDWPRALDELERAARRALGAGNLHVPAQAAYYRGEILRLRGELAGAEQAYREAARGGHEPQPGLALLRLAQGDTGAAAAAIGRVLEATPDRAERSRLLAACVEIMLAAGDLEAARDACAQLEEHAAGGTSDMLSAMAAHARGAVELVAGDARAALPHLRRALTGWHELGAPYEAARARLLLARACCAFGDEDSAAIERDAARDALQALGAALDPADRRDAHGLTAREVEVLRLVAGGATNRAIAAELVLSERTVDRHVSNILAKLRVSSRAAATAYAFRHRLL
jgi:DNA-binding NarL/FixJ family response regulator